MKGNVLVCQVYAPTADSGKKSYWHVLQQFAKGPEQCDSVDIVVVICNFNDKVGMGSGIRKGVIGEFGQGERNQRGDMLIDFCNANDL